MRKIGPLESGWLGRIPSHDPADERPFLLPGVRVRFDPIGPKAVRAAHAAVITALTSDPDDEEEAGDTLSREILRRGIAEWEGIGDAAGIVLPVSPASIDLFLADPKAFLAADDIYVWPYLRRDMEGNGSSASVAGIGAAAMPASDTASSAAAPKQNDAKPARTGSTNRKRTKVKGSGRL